MIDIQQVIVADIGGTNSRLAVVDLPSFKISHEGFYTSDQFKSLHHVIESFLNQIGSIKIKALVLALAGPIVNGQCQLTNLSWPLIDQKKLAERFKSFPVFLINDVESQAWLLTQSHVQTAHMVYKGQPSKGHRALICVGTGLGEAAAILTQQGYWPIGCEGGHCDFAPNTELESELWHYLKRKLKHISYEKILSGSGLVRLYHFLHQEKKIQPLTYLPPKEGPSAKMILDEGLKKADPLCEATRDLFLSILGAECGNCALKYMALGGLYLGGGVMQSLYPYLKMDAFRKSYLDKGRFAQLLEGIEISILEDKYSGLLGAATFAAHLLRGSHV